MSHTVRVFCPACDGASADYRLPPCGECLNIGHVCIDRNEDGTTPKHHHDTHRTPVRLWVDESAELFKPLTDAQTRQA